ncbi:hypothetical protein [Tsukamurella tyrosinosolvens]|uniref:hypothetical protein n=1 Tax=Tsukamurella tyrosinosolvens TaxID=57704 RepID=UPI002DD42281|nr:hypothetical protein [Tsukamurella tyrosinosolvens]MEC4616313.1 hypothetical protein [Tsukamurella tyrosinosolvens]
MTLRQITLRFGNPESTAEVTAEQVTEHFALAPVVRRDEVTGEAIGLTGYMNLTHILTGATLLPWDFAVELTADENRRLAAIAESLPLDWDTVPVGPSDTPFDPDRLFETAFRGFWDSRNADSGITIHV